MKFSILLIVALAVSSFAHAGFPPHYSCSSQGGHITIANNQVTIQTYRHPNLIAENFPESDLNIDMQTVQTMPKQTLGCSSREVTFTNVTISKKDRSPLPHAYNRNAVNGVLNDYMICTVSYSWMPRQGESCYQ
ncbi:MAG: hypothetical protein JNL11_03630 [Bdellovibrionaceae bacterium]|nr:hypothetical protein [Pseudobdellovibrionaceae bacterium]